MKNFSPTIFSYFIGCTFLFCSSVSGQVYNQYYGNIHAHSGYSDGNQASNASFYSTKPCYLYAKQSLHSDFFGISEHNHSMAGMQKADYHKGILEADSVNQNSVFTSLFGMEYGVINNGGHVLVYGIDSLIGWEPGNYDIYNSEYDYNSLFTLIANRQNAFAYLAHMNATDYGDLLSAPYNAVWDQAIAGLAIRSGPAFSTDTLYGNPSTSTYVVRYQDLLKKGYHVSVGIDQDNHYITFDRCSKGRTVVLAASLTRANILDAYRNRRFYASDDWNAKADFRINNHVMGSIFSDASNPTISLAMTDADGESISNIKIWSGVPGSGVAATVLSTQNNVSNISITPSLTTGTTMYYYAEITQADGDKIWTAPIWFTKTATPLPVTLVQFTALQKHSGIQISWTTASEINNDHFTLFRSDAKGNLVELCTLGGNGNSTSWHYYECNDPSPLPGTNYYRLIQTDFDGRQSEMQTSCVFIQPAPAIVTAFPNPVTSGEIHFALECRYPSLLNVMLVNNLGVVVYQSTYQAEQGMNRYAIKDENLRDGMYLLMVRNEDDEQGYTRVLIER